MTTKFDCCEAERERVGEEHRRFLAALLEAGELAYSAKSNEHFYQRLVELAVDTVPGAQAGSIQLSVPNSNLFRFIAAVGFDLEQLQLHELDKATFFRDCDNPEAEVQRTPEMATQDREIVEWMENAGRLSEIVSNVSAPVIVEGQAVAFVSLDNFEDPAAFDQGSHEMVTLLSRFVGDIYVRRSLEAALRSEREALRQLATHDPLTGLANRRFFESRFHQVLVNAERQHRPLAILFLDVDDLKQINDTHGHAVGDQVLSVIGHRTEGVLRASDLVARWGGDEFLVLLTRVDAPDHAVVTAERILAAFAEPINLESGETLSVSLSIGVGWSFDAQLTEKALLRVADEALYDAKSADKGCVRLHKA